MKDWELTNIRNEFNKMAKRIDEIEKKIDAHVYSHYTDLCEVAGIEPEPIEYICSCSPGDCECTQG